MKISPELKSRILLEEKITNWARHTWGLDDNDCLSAEEAYEMLEDGVKYFVDQAIKQERSRVVGGMRVRITFTEDSPFKGATEILENITEIHYCYNTPMNEPRTAFESDIDSTGITYENRWIKEFEALSNPTTLDTVKEDV